MGEASTWARVRLGRAIGGVGERDVLQIYGLLHTCI
jgi:hypothetical protein